MKTETEIFPIVTDLIEHLRSAFVYPSDAFFLRKHTVEHVIQLKGCKLEQIIELAVTTPQADLCADYSRLFIGPFKLLAPPYGSVYLEEFSMVNGESTRKVRDILQQFNFTVREHEMPDHILTELEFLLYLSHEVSTDAKNTAEIKKVYKDFFYTCFQPWIPEFCKRIKEQANTDFYKQIAECLDKSTIEIDLSLQLI